MTKLLEKLHLSRISINVFLIIACFGLDKVLAFFRARITTGIYQDTVHILDTFNAANNLPDMLFSLISAGAFGMAFIPLLTEYLEKKDRAAAWDLFSRVANLAFIVTGVMAIIIGLFANQLADYVITPGFTPEQRALLADLMRLNLVGTVIFSISGLLAASLQANQHFLTPALAPSAYNIGQILGAIFFVPSFGVYGLVYGVILGAVFHLLIQVPALFYYNFRWTPILDLKHAGLWQAIRLIWPRLVTMGGIQLIFLLRDNLASRLDQPGAISALTYGWMIMQVPETLLGTAVATAILPPLAELATRESQQEFKSLVERAMRIMLVLSIPAAAVAAAGINPIARTLFRFDANVSELLTWTTRAYLLTLTGYTIHEIAVRAFYARKEPLVPLAAVVLRLVLFGLIGGLGVTLFKEIGAPIIALAELSLLVEAILLYAILSRRTGETIHFARPLALGLLAAVIAGPLTYFLALYLPGGAAVTALAGMVIGGLVSLAIVWSEAKQVFHL